MDNDNLIIKQLKKIYRVIRFKAYYHGLNILNEEAGNRTIAELIKAGNPAMIARGGAVELRCVEEFLNNGQFSADMRKEVRDCAGVFPTDDDTLRRFCDFYIQCMKDADLLAIWGVGAEKKIVLTMSEKIKFTNLTALEPYYFSQPWSRCLKNKKVLVVHPFVESIKKQYQIRDVLFEDKNVLPQFGKLSFVKAVQSNAGETPDFNDWFAALDYMERQIDGIDFDIAIIGAGAYSLPLAAYVKNMGKIAVQMSGATQILFGIKGKRWEQIPEIAKHFNQHWIRPSETETPKGKSLVEGGSYW